MKILIVDDHPLFRAGFQAVLEQSTLEAGVLSVSSVTEALQTLQRDPDIGLVLLDIHLRVEAVVAAQMDIEQHQSDVRIALQSLQRFGHGRNTQHSRIERALLENRLEAGAEQRIVIDDEDFHDRPR